MLTKQEARERMMEVLMDEILAWVDIKTHMVEDIVNHILDDPELAKGWESK